MRKPINRLNFRPSAGAADSQPMLKRNLRLRYDHADDVTLSGDDPLAELFSDTDEADMDVLGAGAVGGTGAIRPAQLAPAQGPVSTAASGLTAPQDEVQISSAARALGQLEQAGQIHEARLAEIRAAIADGTYETAEKIEAAVENLLKAIRSHR